MPRNNMSKEEVKIRVMKLKHALYDGTYMNKNGEWHDGAHTMLNKMLDILDEYRQ